MEQNNVDIVNISEIPDPDQNLTVVNTSVLNMVDGDNVDSMHQHQSLDDQPRNHGIVGGTVTREGAERDDAPNRSQGESSQKKRKVKQSKDHLIVEKSRKRGDTIKKIIEYQQNIPGSRVFFKSAYVTPGGHVRTYQVGEDFVLDGDDDRQLLTVEGLKSAVKEAVDEIIQPIAQTAASTTTSTTTQASIDLSPQKHTQKSVNDPDLCDICDKTHVVEGLIKFSSAWIACSGDGKPCQKCAHVQCLGFMVSDEVVSSLPNWYCSKHRAHARMVARIPFKYVDQHSDESE